MDISRGFEGHRGEVAGSQGKERSVEKDRLNGRHQLLSSSSEQGLRVFERCG